MTPQTLDRRELIPMDYNLESTEFLENLKASIMHSVVRSDLAQQALHRELTAIRLILATRRIVERELPVNTDLLEPEYSAWAKGEKP